MPVNYAICQFYLAETEHEGLKRSNTMDCLRAFTDPAEFDVFALPEEESTIATCVMIRGLKGNLANIEIFLQDLRENGFEPTYVRALCRKKAKQHDKYVNFATAEQMYAFLDFVQQGSVLGRRLSQSKISVSRNVVPDVPLFRSGKPGAGEKFWYNPEFYPEA